MRLGADVEHLDQLASAMERAGAGLDVLRRELASAASTPHWKGADADHFRRHWREASEPAVTWAGRALHAAAGDVRRQAADQRRVAEPTTGVVAVVASLVGVTRSASLPAPPERVRIMTAGVAGSAGFVAAGAVLRFRVEDLGGGRSRIVELETVSGGGVLDADRRGAISVGDRTVRGGAGAAASAMATIGFERSWVLPTDDVDVFLASRLLDPAGAAGRSVVGDVASAVPGIGLTSAILGVGDVYRTVTYTRPEPERIGVAAGSELGADGAAALDGLAGELSGAVALGVVAGVSYTPADGSASFTLDAAFVAEGAARGPSVGGGSGGAGGTDSAGTTTFTVDRHGVPTTLTTFSSTVDGDRVVQRRSVIDLTRPELVGAAKDLVAAVRSAADDPRHTARRVTQGLQRLLAIGRATAANRTDTYVAGGSGSYGVEVPIGSITVSTEELRLQP